MRNRYQGLCFVCNKKVEPGEGFFQSIGSLSKEERKNYIGKGKWLVRCIECKNKGNKLLLSL